MLLRKTPLRIRLIVLSTFVVALLAYVMVRSSAHPPVLPPGFVAARQAASLVSQEIAALTSATNGDISQVNVSDLQGNVQSATALIREAREKNAAAYQRAVELSGHLKNLAESLSALPSRRAQQAAYEAVAVELSLVSEFIGYTEYLNRFLDSLNRAVATNAEADRAAVAGALQEVNARAAKINELNAAFAAKMQVFDRSL